MSNKPHQNSIFRITSDPKTLKTAEVWLRASEIYYLNPLSL